MLASVALRGSGGLAAGAVRMRLSRRITELASQRLLGGGEATCKRVEQQALRAIEAAEWKAARNMLRLRLRMRLQPTADERKVIDRILALIDQAEARDRPGGVGRASASLRTGRDQGKTRARPTKLVKTGLLRTLARTRLAGTAREALVQFEEAVQDLVGKGRYREAQELLRAHKERYAVPDPGARNRELMSYSTAAHSRSWSHLRSDG